MRSTHLSISQRGRGSAYELREASNQPGRSKDGHRATQRTPWEVASEDGASDEVQIIGGSEVKEAHSDNEHDFGPEKNQIWVTRDVKMVQDDA